MSFLKGVVSEKFLGVVAGDAVRMGVCAHIAEFGVLLPAYIRRIVAACVETARLGWIGRIRHITLQNDSLPLRLLRRIRYRNG